MKITRKELMKGIVREKRIYKEDKNIGQTLGYTIMAIIIILLFIGGYTFFFYINPITPLKPELQKPAPDMIEESIEYVGNEMGGYKLKEHPITKELPKIEFYMTNFDKIFTIIVEDGNVTAVEGRIADPDIRMTGKKDVLTEMLDSADVKTTVQRLMREHRLQVELLASQPELALKGYSSFYDMFGGAAVFTGAAIGEEFIDLDGIRNGFLMLFMSMIVLFVIVLYEVKK
ncbi:MAG: hypothetical protein KAT43_02615 [Nanoarchaeota archaeon]|nr:hypothetical protein [Nanoarchaeota archaeon]